MLVKMARVMLMWLLMSISIKCCNSIDFKEPFGILMCRRKCNNRTGYLRVAFDASVLRCSMSENLLQKLLQNKKVFFFKADSMGHHGLSNMKSTLTQKPNQKAAGTLPGMEGSDGQRCVYLKGITLELDMLSLHAKLDRLLNSKTKFTPSTHRFKHTMGGRFTAVLYSLNIYFFIIDVRIESQSHGNAMYCAVGVCLRRVMDTAKHIGDQTDTWGFSLHSSPKLMYIRKLGSKQRYAWAKEDRMSNKYSFGLLVDLTQGRLLVTDTTGRRLLLNIAGLPTNATLIPIMESLRYISFAVRITGRKLPNKEEHIVKHIKHHLNGINLCDENSLLQAKGKYPGKIQYASFRFLPSKVPGSCRLSRGWLMIGRHSTRKRAIHWKQGHCGMHDQIVALFNFIGHKVFFWSFKVDIKNKIANSSHILKTRKICFDIYYQYGKLSFGHPSQWGFKFYMNPWKVSIQSFPHIKNRPMIYLPLSIARFVIILDKINGRLLLVDPEDNKVIAMVKGVHGLVDPKLIFCFINNGKSSWRLAIKPDLEDETSYTSSQVQDVLSGFD